MIKHTHKGKLMILKMVLENWGYNEGQKYGMDSRMGKLYLADWDRVCYLLDTMKKREKPGVPRRWLTKDEMVEMNFLFKRYDGERNKTEIRSKKYI
jgi:hypothetical protein